MLDGIFLTRPTIEILINGAYGFRSNRPIVVKIYIGNDALHWMALMRLLLLIL